MPLQRAVMTKGFHGLTRLLTDAPGADRHHAVVSGGVLRLYVANHEVGAKFNHITELEELDGNHNERAVVRLYPNYMRVIDTNSDVHVFPLSSLAGHPFYFYLFSLFSIIPFFKYIYI